MRSLRSQPTPRLSSFSDRPLTHRIARAFDFFVYGEEICDFCIPEIFSQPVVFSLAAKMCGEPDNGRYSNS